MPTSFGTFKSSELYFSLRLLTSYTLFSEDLHQNYFWIYLLNKLFFSVSIISFIIMKNLL